MALLDIEHVNLSFPGSGGGRDVCPPTLEDVSVSVRDGEFVTILGPSGCGKTTLLRIVAGLERATDGSIVFQGAPVKKPGSDRVMVFQQPWLYPWLTVRQNIEFGLKLASRRCDRAKIDHMLAIVGLAEFQDYAPYRLSGGMQQRAALARALVMSPRLLLMDEPFGALDAQTRRNLQGFLLGLWEEVRPAVLFVTHDVEEAILLADRVLVMGTRPGRIALELQVALPRPRGEDVILDPYFLDLRRQALDTLRDAALSASGITAGDVPSVSARPSPAVADAPIPGLVGASPAEDGGARRPR